MRPKSNPIVLAALVVSVAGCTGPDIDRPWSINERRVFYSSLTGGEKFVSSAPGEYVIVIPQGVLRQTLALAATESLAIGEDVTVKEPAQQHAAGELGSVSSIGSLAIGAQSRVGAVYALGRSAPQLHDTATVKMYIKSSLPVAGHPRAEGKPTPAVSVKPFVEEYRWTETASGPKAAGILARRVGEAAQRVPPGSYESLVVPANGAARLRAGSYFFTSLVVQPGGVLEIENTSGLVYISVAQTLTISGKVREYSRRESTLIAYEGSASPTISAAFQGTLVAPNATILLPATDQPHSGSFFGRAIRVADHAVIEHRTFLGWGLISEDVSSPCGVCALFANAAVRRCCAKSYRPTPGDLVAASEAFGADRAAAAFKRTGDLEECLSQVIPNFIACEERSFLVPEACAELGHGYQPPSSCGAY
jgi:hypothetical protein